MVALIVPWRPGDVYREAAWALLRDRHRAAHPTWPIIEGHAPDGDWCKAAAIAAALRQTSTATLIIHDADVWCDELALAVAAIDDSTRWAVPHGKVWRLARGQLEPTSDRTRLDQPPYTGFAGGGVVVVDRAAYESCPLDPRFVGWGQEDQALAVALSTLFGAPWRGDAPLWHWWHPPQERQNRRQGSQAGQRLLKRYKAAARSRAAMEALIAEGRASWTLSD